MNLSVSSFRLCRLRGACPLSSICPRRSRRAGFLVRLVLPVQEDLESQAGYKALMLIQVSLVLGSDGCPIHFQSIGAGSAGRQGQENSRLGRKFR